MDMRKTALFLALLLVWTAWPACATEYHVSVTGNNADEGSASEPFRTINHAAQVARPGDVILVHAGTYREWINPLYGGESDAKRIVYKAAPGEKVEIKGSEVITGWKKDRDGVWKVTIPASLFKDYNPYRDSVYGDWFSDHGRIHHTGEVFLNGKSLYEKEKLEKVYNPVPVTESRDQDGSLYTWYCESDDEHTTIWANFRGYDPNRELLEISIRKTCFYPDRPGINYIACNGCHISQGNT